MLFLAIFIQSFGQRVMKRYRKVWLLAVIVLLGFWTGNLLSMTLVMGWSAEGDCLATGTGTLWSLSCCILIPGIHQKEYLLQSSLSPRGDSAVG